MSPESRTAAPGPCLLSSTSDECHPSAEQDRSQLSSLFSPSCHILTPLKNSACGIKRCELTRNRAKGLFVRHCGGIPPPPHPLGHCPVPSCSVHSSPVSLGLSIASQEPDQDSHQQHSDGSSSSQPTAEHHGPPWHRGQGRDHCRLLLRAELLARLPLPHDHALR